MKSLVRSLALSALVLALAAPVFAQGQTPSSTTTKSTMRTTRHTGTRMHAKKGTWMKVDINTATAEELMKLPGVDQATADKIIAGRPYNAKGQLETKHVLTRREYSRISSRIYAKPEKSEKGEKSEMNEHMNRK